MWYGGLGFQGDLESAQQEREIKRQKLGSWSSDWGVSLWGRIQILTITGDNGERDGHLNPDVQRNGLH